MTIYKPCGIRGDASTELSPEQYRQWGHALGRWVEPLAKFVVGGDMRRSTPLFKEALIDGLCSAGVDCIDLGQLPTPMVHHAKRRIQADGCAVVTGAHHPAEFNGLTWMVGSSPPTPEQVDRLRQAAEQPADADGDRTSSTPRTLDISFDYVAWLQETWCDSIRAQEHLVVDTMHGCWSGRARRYLHAIFPECLVTSVRDVCDPEFHGDSPDCSRAEGIEELCETVYRQRAHLGIAFDGDGDRIALVDGRGVPLTAEETTWILLRSLGRQIEGQPVVYDLKLSDRLSEAARKFGAEPVMEQSSRALVHARMRESGAAFGAQAHGHYFFAELDGGDDALFTACRVIAYLAESGETLSDLRRRCPEVFMTPDLRVPLPPEARQTVVDQLSASLGQFPQVLLDGLRVDLPGGWALVRTSGDETGLAFRFEAFDWPSLDSLVGEVCSHLPSLGTQLWASYESAMGRR